MIILSLCYCLAKSNVKLYVEFHTLLPSVSLFLLERNSSLAYFCPFNSTRVLFKYCSILLLPLSCLVPFRPFTFLFCIVPFLCRSSSLFHCFAIISMVCKILIVKTCKAYFRKSVPWWNKCSLVERWNESMNGKLFQWYHFEWFNNQHENICRKIIPKRLEKFYVVDYHVMEGYVGPVDVKTGVRDRHKNKNSTFHRKYIGRCVMWWWRSYRDSEGILYFCSSFVIIFGLARFTFDVRVSLYFSARSRLCF